jgi:hypothetical protein
LDYFNEQTTAGISVEFGFVGFNIGKIGRHLELKALFIGFKNGGDFQHGRKTAFFTIT